MILLITTDTSTRSIEGKQHYSVHDQDYILQVNLVTESKLKYARIPGIHYHGSIP